MTEIEFALSQPNEIDQLELVGTVLWNKVSSHKTFKTLSLPEHYFIYIDIFESELNHGGLFHFFYNNSGQYAHQVLEAFNAINAEASAKIFYEALLLFPEIPVPKDIIKRRFYMNRLEDSIQQKWDVLEDEFINSEEDLVKLLLIYIKNNQSYFEKE